MHFLPAPHMPAEYFVAGQVEQKHVALVAGELDGKGSPYLRHLPVGEAMQRHSVAECTTDTAEQQQQHFFSTAAGLSDYL
jgi:hypothetical protein